MSDVNYEPKLDHRLASTSSPAEPEIDRPDDALTETVGDPLLAADRISRPPALRRHPEHW
jgi:hypothetical protein